MKNSMELPAERLLRCAHLLDTLSASTEEEFLHIASQLKDIHDRTGRISELASAVVGFVSGDIMVEAIRELNTLTEQASGHLKRSGGRIKGSIGKLHGIAESINEVYEHIDAMNRLTRNLYKLGFFTKIENSSLRKTEKGLESLGEDVRQLSESIIRKTKRINESARALTNALNASLSEIQGIGNRQQFETSAVIETTVASISSLIEKYHLSAGVAKEISSASHDMSSSIWEIVTSIQFHDITRQQFDRSKKNLDTVLKDMSAGSEWKDPSYRRQEGSDEDVIRSLARICLSEPVQLAHARTEFVTAVKSVIKNLRSVSEKMKEMLHKTRNITGVDLISGSFLGEIEDVLSAVTSTISALDGDTAVMKELSGIITLTVSTARSILDFADEIEEIGDDVGLLAINAAAAAQRIGDEGRPFSVIAGSISRISLEAAVHTGAISGTLKTISSLARELSEDAPLYGEAGTATDTSADLERLIASLHSVNRDMAHAFKDIEESESALSGEIEEIIVRTNIHAVVDRTTEEVLSLLKEAASRMIVSDGGALGSGTHDREKRSASEGAASSDSLSILRMGSGEFGDNVDLF